MGITSEDKAREEEIRSLVDQLTPNAFHNDDSAIITVCMAPCMSPPHLVPAGCPLCERVTVMPSGIVLRETRNH